jgi:hypothetical protein
MRYEIQIFTLCDGWVNTWTVHHEDGTSEPETFSTEEEAQTALDEFFADIQEEIDAGQRETDEGYDREEFRIMPAGAA